MTAGERELLRLEIERDRLRDIVYQLDAESSRRREEGRSLGGWRAWVMGSYRTRLAVTEHQITKQREQLTRR